MVELLCADLDASEHPWQVHLNQEIVLLAADKPREIDRILWFTPAGPSRLGLRACPSSGCESRKA